MLLQRLTTSTVCNQNDEMHVNLSIQQPIRDFFGYYYDVSLHGSRGTLSLFKADPFSGSGTRESLGNSFGKREASPVVW